MNVPDEGYSRNPSFTLKCINFVNFAGFGCKVGMLGLAVRFGCKVGMLGLAVRFGCKVGMLGLGCKVWL